MASISDLGEWADHLEEAYNQPVEDQAKITEAGAKVLKKNMEDYVRSHHYTHRKTGEDPHLADSVIETPTNVDGKVEVPSTVGFDPKKGYIARFLNDGTKYIRGDDFLDKVRNASKPAIFQAENEEFQKILHQKGLDDV